ncbi:hypothetical protein TNCV_405861 [Trichonephila clavipes]|nr:hypothetical protein TNCV_405861 [Trichonephila clavipes]
MIKFIDFCVVPARISSQSSRRCWRSPLPHALALIQRDFGSVLRVQQTKQLPHVAKVDQTQIRPSWCCRQMRDSSVKTTSFHSAAHILLSLHYWRRRRLGFCVKGRLSHGHLADRPLCCKRRRNVFTYFNDYQSMITKEDATVEARRNAFVFVTRTWKSRGTPKAPPPLLVGLPDED